MIFAASPVIARFIADAVGASLKESGGWIDAVFTACVEALLTLASKLGVSYNAVNVWIFCILWPLLTLTLIFTVLSQRRRIRRLQRSLRVVVSTKL